MKTSPTIWDRVLIEGLLRVVSQQWSALGVNVQADPAPRAVIDPEALLWCTLDIGRYDSRLFDEVIDWLESNHNQILVTRLRKTGPEKQDVRWRILSAIAGRIKRKKKARKWNILAEKPEPDIQKTPETQILFRSRHGRNQGVISGRKDPDFDVFGLERGRIETRSLSQAPCLNLPSSLILRAKTLFGADARAYVWAGLFTRDGVFKTELTESTGYTSLNVGQILKDFVDCGICRAEKRSARNWYTLVNRRTWAKVLNIGESIPPWPNWINLFRGLVYLSQIHTRCIYEGASQYIFSSELRKAFIHVKKDLVSSAPAVEAPLPDLYLVDEFQDPFKAYLEQTLERCLFLENRKLHPYL